MLLKFNFNFHSHFKNVVAAFSSTAEDHTRQVSDFPSVRAAYKTTIENYERNIQTLEVSLALLRSVVADCDRCSRH